MNGWLKQKLSYGLLMFKKFRIDHEKKKPFRSEAERIALHQRWLQIALTATSVFITTLTALKVFGII